MRHGNNEAMRDSRSITTSMVGTDAWVTPHGDHDTQATGSVKVRSVGERGGMEVSSVRLSFGRSNLDALMYRSPDGKVQEYLLFRP